MSDDHSQLGAAPATLFKCDNCGAKYPQRHNGWDTERCIRCGRVTHQPDAPAAPAQPDARDAEIARLRMDLAIDEARADREIDRLTKELEEARAALQATNKHAATVAHERDYLMQVDLPAATERADAAEAQAKALREALKRLEWLHYAPDGSDHPTCTVCGGSRPHHAPGCWLHAILAPPEPKAETPAETAGQKEGAKPLVYLACPYSHPDREVRAARWALVNYAAGELMAKGEKVFSPISHTHPIAEAHDLPLGWDFWEAFDRAYIGHSHKLIVLMLDGWRESKGVQAEIAIAQEMGIPVEYMDPPAPPSLHPAQPSQDVAGTSGESLAGPSKEGSETP